MKINKIAFLPDTPTRKQWESLTISELIMIAKAKRSIKYPFKKVLIDYLLQTGLR
jgi:hypothetical protein